ncbi:MAG: NAD(P)-dependent oxidoreductase [Deferrisomatales bacterium]|nr:NAD(P)-dependent oxidoreductase [Deferrisomatales bacterium]
MPKRSRLALIGSNGMLASMIRRVAPPQYKIAPFDLPGFDLTDQNQVLRTLDELRPEVIVNCAAYTDVDGCETREDVATRVNGEGVRYLAEAAQNVGATLMHISTDYVFDGANTEPYVEDDPTGPRSAYGRSKLAGEQALIKSELERFFLVRTSWLYGPGGKNWFIREMPG